MTRFLIGSLVVLCIAHWALALPVATSGVNKNCSGLLHNVEFDDPGVGLKAISQPLELTSVSVRLQIYQGDSTFGCSGAFISDSGDVLSASHCFDSCRFNADQTPKIHPAPCLGSINGARVEFEVVAAGACSYDASINAADAQNDSAAMSQIPADCRSGKIDDTIVIRAKKLPADFAAFRCLPLAKSPLPLGSNVFTLGYPSATQRSFHRPAAKDSNGRDLYISSGTTIKSEKCEATLYNNSPVTRWWTGQDEHKEKWSVNSKTLNAMKDMYQTTVDAVPGNSGGPLINSDDEIAGVASTADVSTIQSEMWECRGATFFQPTSELAQRLKDKGLEASMNCQSKKLTKGQSL